MVRVRRNAALAGPEERIVNGMFARQLWADWKPFKAVKD